MSNKKNHPTYQPILNDEEMRTIREGLSRTIGELRRYLPADAEEVQTVRLLVTKINNTEPIENN